jgi:RNA polymerase sigma-70 factor (ECF subfamily)
METEHLRSLLVPFISKRVDPQDVDDVVQSVFVRIQRGLDDLRDGDRLVAWGYQIARNVIVDHIRRRAVRTHEPLDRLGSVTAPLEDDERAGAELAPILGHFVGMLPDMYREALQLTELDGMTQADAAARVGLSLPGMKSRVQRARAQLRELLEECCDISLDTRGGIVDVEPSNPPADLPNCCAHESAHPTDPPRVSRDMTNTRQASTDIDNSKTTEASACCGGPAPADANACCVKDAAAKAAGESGCGCSTKAASPKKQGGCC